MTVTVVTSRNREMIPGFDDEPPREHLYVLAVAAAESAPDRRYAYAVDAGRAEIAEDPFAEDRLKLLESLAGQAARRGLLGSPTVGD